MKCIILKTVIQKDLVLLMFYLHPQTKSGDTVSAGGKSVVANVAAASGKSDPKVGTHKQTWSVHGPGCLSGPMRNVCSTESHSTWALHVVLIHHLGFHCYHT